MAHDGQTLPPNVYDAEPIPDAARAEIDRLLSSGDLFRYTAAEGAPVALLEQEFAELLGSRYALAVSSCSAALFLSLKALDAEIADELGLPPGSEGLAVVKVDPASEAADKGLDRGDIIVEAGQRPVKSLKDLTDRIDEAKEGGRKSLLLLVRRDGDPRFVALSIE